MANSAPSHDERLRRPALMRSLQLGETKVTYVPDGAVQLRRSFLPGVSDEVWAAHPEYLDEEGYLVAGVGGLLVERDGRALLIDAGFGPQSLPAAPGSVRGPIHGGALRDNLAALGRRPEEIEAVAVTHLHLDHIGWLWHPAPGSDRPAFAHADYLLSEPEWSQRAHAEAHGISKEALDALEPRVRTVADGEEIFPGVTVLLTHGHTPGHAAYVINSGGKRLIALGDAMHSPIQIGHPEWSAAPDHDAELSAAFRRRLVDELAEPDTIGFAIHFADVVFGQVKRDEQGTSWHPVP